MNTRITTNVPVAMSSFSFATSYPVLGVTFKYLKELLIMMSPFHDKHRHNLLRVEDKSV